MDESLKKRILNSTVAMRKNVLKMTYNAGIGGAHIGGGLSLIEIMATLYIGVLKYDLNNMQSEYRDRLIFSKGHGTLALYIAMQQVGIISSEDLNLYKKDNSFLSAHPSINASIGIEYSSGSLGQGLSLAVGTALALKRKNNDKSKVYVILGDGECNEGAIWEAAQSASHFKCNNIVAIVDCNGIQYDGFVNDIMNQKPFGMKWEAFGWEVRIIDGHNIEEIYNAIKGNNEKPLVVLAKTIKGKGISFMENNPIWHNHNLSYEQYEIAINELKELNNEYN